jgi:hypothetical protein
VLVGCTSGKDPETGFEGDQCLSCHQGIEPIHPEEAIAADDCVSCHGGDPAATTVEGAHVAVPANFWEIRGDGLPSAQHGFIKDFAPEQLDALDPDYLRFVNPGDIRVAGDTCGPCHSTPVDLVNNVRRSIMTTNAGHYMPTRFTAGLQDRDAIYGSYPVSDPHWEGQEGTVPELISFDLADEVDLQAALDAGDQPLLTQYALDHYLAKSCNTCHAAGYPRNNAPHLYRSTGCTSCHMIYNKDGVYTGDDPAISNSVPVYPDKHVITKAIPTSQCTTCHYQGGRIGLLFQGIREGGFGTTPENAEVWAESAFGHASGYYILDEDTTNDIDETPPDLHFSAGMDCGDCHVGTDVHGDGRLYSTEKHQLDIRCEDCHGTPRQRILPAADGAYYTVSGRKLPQLSTGSDGAVVLTTLVEGKELAVPQPQVILDSGTASSDMIRAMKPNADDWAHPDSVTCDTCHNNHQQFCIGCHVSYDPRFEQVDYQTGTKTTGLVRGSRDTFSLDHFLLAMAPDGRAQATNPSQHLQLTIHDFDGELQMGGEALDEDLEPTGEDKGEFRSRPEAETNMGFAPFFQHTTSKKPRSCDTCHQQSATPEELTRVKGVYGFGTGDFMQTHPNGEPVDVLRFLDDEGNPTTTWVHEGTGPLPEAMRNRALGVILDDLEAE